MGSMNVRAVIACAGIAALAGGAQATITVYTTQVDFNNATSAQGVDTYDDLAPGGLGVNVINRTAGAYNYTATDTSGIFVVGPGPDRWLSNNTATSTIVFDGFSAGVSAAGGFFFGSDFFGDFAAGDMMLSATDADGTVNQMIIGATTSSFVGFVSNGDLTSISLSAMQPAGGNLWPSANDFTLAIPAPSAAALLGLGGFVGTRRRR